MLVMLALQLVSRWVQRQRWAQQLAEALDLRRSSGGGASTSGSASSSDDETYDGRWIARSRPTQADIDGADAPPAALRALLGDLDSLDDASSSSTSGSSNSSGSAGSSAAGRQPPPGASGSLSAAAAALLASDLGSPALTAATAVAGAAALPLPAPPGAAGTPPPSPSGTSSSPSSPGPPPGSSSSTSSSTSGSSSGGPQQDAGETVEWVNMCWRKVWRVYQRGLERWIIDLLQPVFDQLVKDGSVPRWLCRLRIVELTLDHEAPYFSNMRRRNSRKDSDLNGVVDLRYTGGARMLLMLELGESRGEGASWGGWGVGWGGGLGAAVPPCRRSHGCPIGRACVRSWQREVRCRMRSAAAPAAECLAWRDKHASRYRCPSVCASWDTCATPPPLATPAGEGRWRFKVPVLVSDLDLECQMWLKLRLAPMCPWIGTIGFAFVGPPNVKVQLSPYNRVRLMRVPVVQVRSGVCSAGGSARQGAGRGPGLGVGWGAAGGKVEPGCTHMSWDDVLSTRHPCPPHPPTPGLPPQAANLTS